MRFLDIFNSDQCIELFKSINEFSKNYLKCYNDQIETLGLNFEKKDIFDIVWGTIELSKAEICLIDSPLIQRLRNIQQLGFASYVYCNADYSRFAHTIGVVEAAGRITKVIEKNLPPKKEDEIFNMREIVRLCAIFHDTGHMFFSHVSENFFTYNKEFPENDKITKALTFFNENISAKVTLHEMLSVMIVNSDEVRRFLKLPVLELKSNLLNNNLNKFIDYMSGLIVGTAIDKDILPYSMIIKSGIDADRLDYLYRDSAITKVPLAVDIARLINKITVVELENYNSKSTVWNDFSKDKPYKVMAIKYSAQRLIWQLSMARSIMYQSIYFHHKKLTAETMFRKACEKIFKILPAEKRTLAYIMSLTDQAMSEYFHHIVVPENLHENQYFLEAKDVIKRIRDRNFYKRVASFSQEAASAPNYIYEFFVTNVIENQFSEDHQDFVISLKNEYINILKILGEKQPENDPVFMFIEANWQIDFVADIPIDYGNFSYKFSSIVFKDTPVFGEQNRHKQYYIVTDQQERILVYIALEKVLLKKHKIRIDVGASTCAKFSLAELEEEKNKLFEKKYYNDCPELLSDNIIINLFDNAVFKDVIQKYQTFSGTEDSKINEKTLLNYLKQFLILDCEKNELSLLLDGILLLLKKAVFINRDFISNNMPLLLNKISDKKGNKKKNLVKLGGSLDSANHMTYFFNDIKNNIEKENGQIFDYLPEALPTTNDANICIIIYDDAAYSGKQVISIFQELMGIPIDQRETDEEHGQKLSEEDKEKIKTCDIVLAYLCFNNSSEEYILENLKKLGINNVCIEYVHDLTTKVFDPKSKIFSSTKQQDIVQRHLKNIGYKIQKSAETNENGELKERWDEERVKSSSLGYNDAQQIVVLEHSIPTYSLTPLWQNGKFNEFKWKGLFQRTKKN
jgi:HD superfamily phosphohydrolase